ncbi:MAG TPA: SAM-dependent methyltransferase [Steroidobacteraceae bacterium]|nr:SAM-dependent methyltransferase [Steroidobacteraceae bacterium]
MIAFAPLSTLPPLSAEEREHADRVEALIRRRIAAAGGWIDFETFMDLALYAPGLGYYSAGSAKLGPAGDFVTAPELGALFSACVARQCAEILAGIGGGEIVELGGGTGRMAAHLLGALERMDALPERYAILEVSADLRARQQQRIAALTPSLARRVVWLERWPAPPVRGVLLANEVLDALACQRFCVGPEGIRALGVALAADGALEERERPPGEPLRAACEAVLRSLPHPLPAGYRSEICLRIEPWIGAIGDLLERGALLLFDYGLPRAQYYHPERCEGTLRAHFRHRAHDDPLTRIGLQDLTAWVDFTRVAEAAQAARLDVQGFATQAAFLLGTGIEELLAGVSDPKERARMAGEARRLLLPGEMGEAFKVMAVGRGCPARLRGFAHQDLRASL